MENRNKQAMSFLGGMAIGVATMFLADPAHGRRRRALLRDQFIHNWKSGKWALRGSILDLGHRLRGGIAEARSRFRDEEVPDDILVARVRSKIGRVVTHPHAIQVSSEKGRLTLVGPIPEAEAEKLINAAFSVHGVREVSDQLDLYRESAEGRRPA